MATVQAPLAMKNVSKAPTVIPELVKNSGKQCEAAIARENRATIRSTQWILVRQPAEQNNINSTLTLTLIKIICIGYIAQCIRIVLY